MNIAEELGKRRVEIDEILKHYLPGEMPGNSALAEAMRYSILVGGKRLRPIMMLESYHMFGGKDAAIDPFLAAIEMIHTHSLVHDDLPALDNDEYRRGEKTTHAVYGEAVGVLAGAGLLNLAYETVLSAYYHKEERDRVLQAMRILAGKTGLSGMLGGRLADIYGRKRVSITMFLLVVTSCTIASFVCRTRAVIPFLFLTNSFSSAAYPGVSAMLADAMRGTGRREGFSLLYLSSNLGIAIGPSIGGMLFYNHLPWVFRCQAIFVGLAVAFFAAFTRDSYDPSVARLERSAAAGKGSSAQAADPAAGTGSRCGQLELCDGPGRYPERQRTLDSGKPGCTDFRCPGV